MSGMRFTIALAAGKICAALCKSFFPKRGSNLPGAIALKLDPLFLSFVKGVDPAKTVFITGTNGKSTVNNMIVHAFETAGFSVCSNIEGANMKPGVATTIIKNTTKSGRFTKEYLVLEVDERSLASVAEVLPPGNLCVVNIQKDQVQRNGDPDYIYQKIRNAVAGLKAARLFVNNDEPRSKSLGAFIPDGCRVVSFGVAQNARGSGTETGWGVTMPCLSVTMPLRLTITTSPASAPSIVRAAVLHRAVRPTT